MKIYNQQNIPLLEYLISKDNKKNISTDIKSSLREGDIVETKNGYMYCIISNKTIRRYFKQYKYVLDAYLDIDRILYIWNTVKNNVNGGWPTCWSSSIYDSQLNVSQIGLDMYRIVAIYKSQDGKVPNNCKDLNGKWIEKEMSKRKRTLV